MRLCHICKKETLQEVLHACEMVHGTREAFAYALCSECNTLALMEPPANLAPYYENYYSTAPLRHDPFNSQSLLSRLLLNRFRKWALRYSVLSTGPLARYIYQRKTIGSLAWGPVFRELHKLGIPLSLHTRFLDVGSGSGRALHFLASAGFTNLTGCDPFIENDVALSPRGTIFKAAIEEVQGTFDVIMFHHSFEHLPDPGATLQTAAGLLSPNGIILLRFPNIASLEFLKHKENWWGIHAPRHFFLLSHKAIRILALEAGLELQHTYCESTFDHYLYSTEYSLGIHDQDPLSIRADSVGTWTAIEIQNARQKAEVLNEKLCGDWIAYVLRRPNE